MTTPLATIADTLIEFILSLLRDPDAAAEFIADPEETLNSEGLAGICVEDVRAVVPVVVERPEVIVRPVPVPVAVQPAVAPRPEPPQVIKEITTIANHFQIDNRSTIIDQSVNQDIWAEGDVTQLFDQEAVVAVGDQALAAGDEAAVDNSETDIAVGDVAIGNTETTTEINDSFTDESTTVEVAVDAEAEDSFNDQSTDVTIDADIDDSFQQDTTVFATDLDESVVDAGPAVMEAEAPLEVEIDEP